MTNSHLQQFQIDMRPSVDKYQDWADASAFFVSMRSPDDITKEAAIKLPSMRGAKELGRDLAIGSGVGASIGAIRSTGQKVEGENIGQKLKRIGSDAADKAIEGTVQGLAVHGIRRFAKSASALSELSTNAMKTVHSGGKAIKDAVTPHLSNMADFTARKTVENPGAVAAIAGGTLGAGMGAGATYDSPEAAMGGAAVGGMVGAKYGPGLAAKAMDPINPLLGHGFQARMMKVAVPLGALGGIGKTLATSKAAIPLATAGLGGLASKATGGDFTTGAMAGGALGLAGRSGIVKSLGSKQNPLLGGDLARGIRMGQREMAAAKAAKNVAKPMTTGLANAPEAVAKAPANTAAQAATRTPVAAQAAAPAQTTAASVAKSPGSPVVNSTPASQAASAPRPPATPPSAMVPKAAPMQSGDSLQELAGARGVGAPALPRPAASGVVTPAPTSIKSVPTNPAQTINGITVPESGFSGTEISSLNLSGTPKPTMMDNMRGAAGSAANRVQQAATNVADKAKGVYNRVFPMANFNDPKLNNTLQLIETAQNNPKALAGIVNNLDEKTVRQLTRMGVI